ncbi:hypothetical protein BG015_007879 [Linnemannia schmuckeri]|uniref:Centromere protein H C-terminal domain-containing protein n=1 Tax=Linnemannia schmuckeri TaxID=64567 RepID=A0A9P5S9I0_9FUNG|nr:hypothetical protein BG015_007879 [Linnemannia schmuckeri]
MTSTAAVAATTPDAALINTLEAQVLQLADHEAWLDAQIRELEFALDNDKMEPMEEGEEDMSIEDVKYALELRIDTLKQELAVAAALETVRIKVINSAHSLPVVLRSLFKQDYDQDEKILADAINKRDEAVSEYLHIHKDLQTARNDLAETQVKVLDLQDENRRLAQALAHETAAIKEEATSQEAVSNRRMAQRIEEELKTITIKYNVVSNVLQGLLLESGVDWSNDPHYLDVMLKLKSASD